MTGSDGVISIWDVHAKTCRKHVMVNEGNPKPTPVTAMAYNKIDGGKILAYALSYDWSHGYKGNTPGYANKVMLHPLTQEEISRKPQ